MNLDMAKIAPELKKYGFVETGKNIYVKMMDDRKYVVDFGRHVICRMDDLERVTEDKEDENLTWVKKLCMDSMFNRGADNVQKEDDKGMQEAEYTEVSSSEDCNTQVDTIQPTETSICAYSGDIVRPAISAVQAKQAWNEYLNMRKVILEPSDFQKIQGKDFIKKSGWRKFATFYNLTDKIVEETRIPDNGGFIWKIKVICTAPNGRQTEGVAMCASKEKTGARIEHDVYSTAHTRAKNRAISDMIAAGEVSAEEMEY